MADELNSVIRSYAERLEKLEAAKSINIDAGLPTEYVDEAISDLALAREADPEFQLAIFVHTAGAPAVASTTEVVPTTVDTPTEQVQDDSEIRVKPEYKLSIGEHPESGNPVLVMRGAKKPADIMLLELWQIELI